MELHTIKSQIVECPVAAGSTLMRFYFLTQNFLRQKEIVSIETFTVNDLTLAPSGNVLPTTANMETAYLTLYGSDPEKADSKGDWLQEIPLWSLHRVNNGTDPYVWNLASFIPRNIVWEKSFIEVKADLGNSDPLSFLFNVGYQGLLGD